MSLLQTHVWMFSVLTLIAAEGKASRAIEANAVKCYLVHVFVSKVGIRIARIPSYLATSIGVWWTAVSCVFSTTVYSCSKPIKQFELSLRMSYDLVANVNLL